MKTEQLVLPIIEERYPGIDGGSSYQSPLPMQYLGAKTRIVGQLLESIVQQWPYPRTFVDLFAGTGVVSLAADKFGYRVIANDLQRYSYQVLTSLLLYSHRGAAELAEMLLTLSEDSILLRAGRREFERALQTERKFKKAFQQGTLQWKEYRRFSDGTNLVDGDQQEVRALREEQGWNLFSHYYRNTYFGVEQCLQLDALREWAEGLDEAPRTHVIASAVSAMTYAVSGTTHLAQYSKVSSKQSAFRILAKRSIDLVKLVQERLAVLSRSEMARPALAVYNEDFRDALEKIDLDDGTIVYVDPPYFKEHYSRYYHVLDTFVLYDYPELTKNSRTGLTTTGRYRKDRETSDFGKRARVQDAFSDLLTACWRGRAKVAISYADTALMEREQLLDLCKRMGWYAEVHEFSLMHSGQGQPRNRDVTEQLFLLSRD